MNHRGRVSLAVGSVICLTNICAAAAEVGAASKWTGFYVGGSAGVGFGGDSKSVDLDAFNYFKPTPIPGEVTNVGTDSAFIGGGQIGYNHAISTRWVVGIEADISSFDFKAAETPASSKKDWGSDTLVSVEMDWLATVRARLGFAVDQWLIYGTGGLAFSNGEYRNHDFCNTGPCGTGLMDAKGDMGTGWTVGGGLALALASNWTASAEYLFVRFDGKEYSGTAFNQENIATNEFRFSASPADFNIIRVGLNYQFGGPSSSTSVDNPLK
jgi:outer membrane immunogenic protein